MIPATLPTPYSTEVAKATFTQSLAETASVTHAADAAGVSRQTVYRWRQSDPQFADDWDHSLERAADTLEASAYQRAIAGDNLMTIFVLKGMRPLKFRDNAPLPNQALPAAQSIRWQSADEADVLNAEYRELPAGLLTEHAGGDIGG